MRIINCFGFLLALLSAMNINATATEDKPFEVNAMGNYVPAGTWGDASEKGVLDVVMSDHQAGPCKDERVENAAGECHQFYINPKQTPTGWLGVVYMSPAGNWGYLPKFPVPLGKKQMHFHARASKNVKIAFQSGLCDLSGGQGGCSDGFGRTVNGASKSDNSIDVSEEWQQYTIDLSDVDYSEGVLSPLFFVHTNKNNGFLPYYLYLDNIVWQ